MEYSYIPYILLGIIILVTVWLITIYNNLITKQNLTKESWSGIDIQLKRRHDLIPNLLESVKGYMSHEKEVLEEVTALRARSMTANSVTEKANVEGMLTSALSRIMALSENYPDLKANQSFLNLEANLVGIEENIQLARRYYNGAARDFNIKLESFPINFAAKLFNFKTVSYFTLDDVSERTVPTIKFQ
jgi:LemA protein